jgi:hypothetical protein
MALNQHINSAIVRNVLGVSTNAWSLLIINSLINRWSKYKPVCGPWPEGTTGKYGLNLPSNWNYIKPGGRAFTGDPYRAGDFRSYDHDAFPAIHSLISEQSIATLDPGYGGRTVNTWKIRAYLNPAIYPTLIVPSMVGLNTYYIGIKISGSGVYSACKTLAKVEDVSAGGDTILIAANYDIDTNSFSDLPLGSGTYNWLLFISPTGVVPNINELPGWGTNMPLAYIQLPEEGLYKSSGSFTVQKFFYFSNPTPSWQYFKYGNTYQEIIKVGTDGSSFTIDYIPSWIDIVDLDYGDPVGVGNSYQNGQRFGIYPKTAYDTAPDLVDSIKMSYGGITGQISVTHYQITAPVYAPAFTSGDTPLDAPRMSQPVTNGPIIVGCGLTTGAIYYVFRRKPVWTGSIWDYNSYRYFTRSVSALSDDIITTDGGNAANPEAETFTYQAAGMNGGGMGPYGSERSCGFMGM